MSKRDPSDEKGDNIDNLNEHDLKWHLHENLRWTKIGALSGLFIGACIIVIMILQFH